MTILNRQFLQRCSKSSLLSTLIQNRLRFYSVIPIKRLASSRVPSSSPSPWLVLPKPLLSSPLRSPPAFLRGPGLLTILPNSPALHHVHCPLQRPPPTRSSHGPSACPVPHARRDALARIALPAGSGMRRAPRGHGDRLCSTTRQLPHYHLPLSFVPG